jgi:hypothetical protein
MNLVRSLPIFFENVAIHSLNEKILYVFSPLIFQSFARDILKSKSNRLFSRRIIFGRAFAVSVGVSIIRRPGPLSNHNRSTEALKREEVSPSDYYKQGEPV